MSDDKDKERFERHLLAARGMILEGDHIDVTRQDYANALLKIDHAKDETDDLRTRLATAEQERDRLRQMVSRLYVLAKDVNAYMDAEFSVECYNVHAALSATAPERDATGQMGGDNGK